MPVTFLRKFLKKKQITTDRAEAKKIYSIIDENKALFVTSKKVVFITFRLCYILVPKRV